jgi:hypothetical protein
MLWARLVKGNLASIAKRHWMPTRKRLAGIRRVFLQWLSQFFCCGPRPSIAAPRPQKLVALTWGLPVAGKLAGWFFDLFLPGL